MEAKLLSVYGAKANIVECNIYVFSMCQAQQSSSCLFYNIDLHIVNGPVRFVHLFHSLNYLI